MIRLLHPQVAGAAIANRAFPWLLTARRRSTRASAAAAPALADVERSIARQFPLLDGVVAFGVGPGGRVRLSVVAEVSRDLHRAWEEDLSGELHPLLEELKAAIRRLVKQEHGATLHNVVLTPVDSLPLHADADAARDECRQAYLDGVLPALS